MVRKILVAGFYTNRLPILEAIYTKNKGFDLDPVPNLRDAREKLIAEDTKYVLVFVDNNAYSPHDALMIIEDILNGKRKRGEDHLPGTQEQKDALEVFRKALPDLDTNDL